MEASKAAGAARNRHVRTYTILRALVKGAFSRALGFSYEMIRPKTSPVIVIANHTMDFDPILITFSFPEQMYFVASEHVFRKGFWSKLLVYFFAPISRMKGSTASSTALDVLRKLRAGQNICLFAEGDRSFTGTTGPVMPATGKLVRASGATLVTYRFEGGYLTTPRWSASLRHGRIRGAKVGEYPPETLKSMTPEEINALIARDIGEDAFARQEASPVPYRGKNLAEHLEYALFLCPKCGRIGTLKSEGDRFFCDCGLSVTYTEYGSFAGVDVPFANVRDWDAWQIAELEKRAASDAEPLFFDENQSLYRVDEGHQSVLLETGRLTLTREGLSVGARRFPLPELSSLAMFASTNMAFSDRSGAHYEIRSNPTCCRRKYKLLYDCLKHDSESSGRL